MNHLSKRRSTRLGRLAILFMAIMGQINVVFLGALLITESTTDFQLRILPAMRATAWHMRNGNTVTYDGHRFHLPASWYPEPDNRRGALDLRYVSLGTLSLDRIHLETGQNSMNKPCNSCLQRTRMVSTSAPGSPTNGDPSFFKGEN